MPGTYKIPMTLWAYFNPLIGGDIVPIHPRAVQWRNSHHLWRVNEYSLDGKKCHCLNMDTARQNLETGKFRWRSAILTQKFGAPVTLIDDWVLSTREGEVLARVTKSKTNSARYIPYIYVAGEPTHACSILEGVISRDAAMDICEQRIGAIVCELSN